MKKTEGKGLDRRRILMILLALVLCVCTVVVIHRVWDYRQGSAAYEEAEVLVGLPDLSELPPPTPAQVTPTPSIPPEETAGPAVSAEPTPTPTPYVDPYADALKAMDFTALREVNDDVLGWILVPGTGISYPLLRGEDNSYYLDHTWKKTRNSVGSIFMECQCAADFSDFNTIIYGHRVQDRSMFGRLKSYKGQDYWASHPSVYITDGGGTRRYDIFAAFEAPVDSPIYRLGVTSRAGKEAVINEALTKSVIQTGIVPSSADRIITLSTCTGNGHENRWVVLAVLMPQQEAPPEPSPAQSDVPAPSPADTGGTAPVPTEVPPVEPTPAQTQPEGSTPAEPTPAATEALPGDAPAVETASQASIPPSPSE